MILVSSLGGCGSTFFIQWLKRHAQTNNPNDQDGLKHLTAPPDLPGVTRAVYIYSKTPEEQAISLINRGYAKAHGDKLTDDKGPSITEGHLQELLKYGADPFAFESALRKWRGSSTPYPIAFVNYETMWDNVPGIVDFVGAPKDVRFPAKKARKSKLGELGDERVREHIRGLYAGYREYLKDVPDFYVKPGSRGDL